MAFLVHCFRCEVKAGAPYLVHCVESIWDRAMARELKAGPSARAGSPREPLLYYYDSILLFILIKLPKLCQPE